MALGGVYLHLNPVRVAGLGLGKRARDAERTGALPPPTPEQLRKRLAVLRSFPWSSCRACVSLARPPDWLKCDLLTKRAAGARAYRDLVEGRLRQGEEELWMSKVWWGLAFGSESFAERVRRSLAAGGGRAREHAGRRLWSGGVSLFEVVRAVERLKGEPLESFVNRHGDGWRDLIWWAARRLGGLPLAELATWAGGVDYSTVSSAVTRLERRGRTDRGLRGEVAKLEEELSVSAT